MAYGSHLEYRKTTISQLQYDRSTPNLAWCCILTITLSAIKISKFLKSKTADGHNLEHRKTVISW